MKMLYPNGDIYHGTNITLDLCLFKKKKKVKPTYRPCFFLARNLKHNYFFLWPNIFTLLSLLRLRSNAPQEAEMA